MVDMSTEVILENHRLHEEMNSLHNVVQSYKAACHEVLDTMGVHGMDERPLVNKDITLWMKDGHTLRGIYVVGPVVVAIDDSLAVWRWGDSRFLGWMYTPAAVIEADPHELTD